MTLLKLPNESLSRFQQSILKLLYASPALGAVVSLSKLKSNHSKQRENQRLLTKLRRDVKKDLITQGFIVSKKLREMWPMLVLWIGVIGVALVTFFSSCNYTNSIWHSFIYVFTPPDTERV